MNDFDPKEMKKASEFLQDKLEDVAKKSAASDDKVEEERKQSKLKQFVSSIFKR